jgi:two-component system phosphate regulon sensor histidine kinase PhoR
VLSNLVSNAIKYSPFGGQIKIAAMEKGDEAVVVISDQGMGIAEEEQEIVFQPFRRSESTRHSIPGVGIGLANSLKIVKAHGGRISVKSQVGVGSTFEVSLPRRPYIETELHS